MEGFGTWLSIGLATRPGRRGRRQTQPMAGAWCTWASGDKPVVRQPFGMRGSDFSLRVSLLVHGWHRTGLSIQAAAERTAEYDLVQSQLGKSRRGRRSVCSGWAEGETEKDETVRTTYYKFLQRHSETIDQLLESWFWNYLQWSDWAINADTRALDLLAEEYQTKGERENASHFLALVESIRSEARRQGKKSAYRDSDWYRQAEAIAEEWLAGTERLYPADPSHRMTPLSQGIDSSNILVRSMLGLAALLLEQGKRRRAEPLFRRALAVVEQALGSGHPDTAWVSDQLITCTSSLTA